jgi:hypothetical protein
MDKPDLIFASSCPEGRALSWEQPPAVARPNKLLMDPDARIPVMLLTYPEMILGVSAIVALSGLDTLIDLAFPVSPEPTPNRKTSTSETPDSIPTIRSTPRTVKRQTSRR